MNFRTFLVVIATVVCPIMPAAAVDMPDGSAKEPVRVIMVPAEIGSRDTLSDYRPVFNAITKK